jgi:hypothetical protein
MAVELFAAVVASAVAAPFVGAADAGNAPADLL